MPLINVDIDENLDVDIEVTDFLKSCDRDELEQIQSYLITQGQIQNYLINQGFELNSIDTVTEGEFVESLEKLRKNYYSLSKEEEEIINSIAKKFL